MKKTLHVMGNDKFINKYIEFINKNFPNKHFFFIIKGVDYLEVPYLENIIYFKHKRENILKKYFKIFLIYVKLWKMMLNYDKVIFHNLGNNYTILFLFLNPWFLKKSNWVIWGGDIYSYYERDYSKLLNKIFYKIENYVKARLKGYITHIHGDYKLAQKIFGAKGKYYNCFLYLSNLYQEVDREKNNKKEEVYIQVGNSANIVNNHFEILDKLEKYKTKNIKLLCPLSYGDKLLADKIIEYGKNIFGEKFIPITEFMKFEDYMKFIRKVDIAIFASDRQQAVGNITSLLGMEKTVYLKREVTTYGMLKDLGIKVGDFSELNNLELFSIEDRQKNKEIIKERFSEKRLLEDLKEIFDN